VISPELTLIIQPGVENARIFEVLSQSSGQTQILAYQLQLLETPRQKIRLITGFVVEFP
jgi:hypothetical protein